MIAHFKYFILTVLALKLVLLQAFSTREKIDNVDRYFLQIDNLFDYKTLQVSKSYQSKNITEPNTVVFEDRVLQKLDHFDPLEERFFKQRYLFRPPSKAHCGALCYKAPICLFIGGDARIHRWWLDLTFLAYSCRGHLFLLEHRFYGDSLPPGNMTLDNLRYLTVPQALEDISTFILHIRKTYKLEKNQAFVFGASYGGTLAALFRRKYSHLVDAAVALSAPMINDFQNKDYLPAIGQKLKKTDRTCYQIVEHGFRQIARLMDAYVCKKHDLVMCHKMRDNLGLCTPIKGMAKQERKIFFGSLIKDFAILVEFNGVLDVTLKNICTVITHPDINDWSPMDKLLAGDMVISQELFQSKTRSGATPGECIPAKKQPICEYFLNTGEKDHSVTSGRLQRLWQSCSELGSFYTSNGDARQHPFGGDNLSQSFYQEFCECAFGPRFSLSFIHERINDHRKMYGKFLPSVHSTTTSSPYDLGSRIIYTFGEDDPKLQRELKLADKPGMKAKYKENVIFKVKDSAHCGEVFLKPSTIRKLKPRAVSRVQNDVIEQISEWLNL